MLNHHPGRRRRHTGAALVTIALLAVPALTACSSTKTTASSGDGGSTKQLSLTSIPTSLRANYEGYQTFAKLQPNPYKDWTPPKSPTKFCLSTSYLGNTWEQGNLAELQHLVAGYQKMGLASGPLQTENSNGSVPQQITQMNQLISDGCKVMFSIPGSPTALCPTVTKARKAGVLFVTDDTPVNCADALNVSFNGYYTTYLGAKSVMRAMGGKGNIIVLTGIPGAVGTISNEGGLSQALKEFPKVKVLGRIEGDWTASVAQTATAKFLATHSAKVDGVVNFGEMNTAAEQALLQAGRPLAKTNDFGSLCASYALEKQHPGTVTVFENQGPAASAYETFHVAARMLAGQKPMSNLLLYPIPGPSPMDSSALNQWYKPTMTLSSTCFASPPDGKGAAADNYFDPLFSGGSTAKMPTS